MALRDYQYTDTFSSEPEGCRCVVLKAALVWFFALSCVGSARGVSVEFIGDPGQHLSFDSISPDGQSVYGPGRIWSSETGFVDIALPEIGGYVRPPHAGFVSADGSVVAGNAWIGEELPSGGTRVDEEVVVRWDATNGHRELEGLEGGPNESRVRGISADGTAIVGLSYFTDDDYEAVRWSNEGEVLERLGHLGVSGSNLKRSSPSDVSSDGSVIVGVSSGSAFRWTESTGMVPLDSSPVTADGSHANGVSPDGTKIVGHGKSGFQQPDQAFLWDEVNGTRGLGWLPFEAFGYSANNPNVSLDNSRAFATSDDGSIVVGSSGISIRLVSGLITVFDSQYLPFVWTPHDGMMQPADFLEQVHDFSLEDGEVTGIIDVSADGRTLLAEGVDQLDRELTMLITLDDISSTMPGDFDRGGSVDGGDFLRWQKGESPFPLSSTDLSHWVNNYGSGVSASVNDSAIPEPCVLLLLSVGGLTLLQWRPCLWS